MIKKIGRPRLYPIICGIYKITSPSGNIYIGQSINCYNRFRSYRLMASKDNHDGQKRLYNSFRKHGIENHKFEIELKCEREELNDLESVFIILYDSFQTSHGLNLSSGGDKNVKYSEETKQRIKDSIIKRGGIYNKGKSGLYKHSAQIKSIISAANAGENHPMFGKHHSIEARSKISLSSLGRKNPMKESTKLKLSEIKKGTHMSEETKKKISLAFKGKLNTKISKPVSQYSLHGNFIKNWPSAAEADRVLGISFSEISSCINQKVKTAGGFVWISTNSKDKEIILRNIVKSRAVYKKQEKNNLIYGIVNSISIHKDIQNSNWDYLKNYFLSNHNNDTQCISRKFLIKSCK